ncbi:Peptidyl-tRNA hydrolase [Gracilariopsis chorda]|uniref:Peptidyl-tRNA hydrolase n=1 Tax=Gracilariopsis chorda TaxID=448386 RepID=A0A2V3IG78_9FLOR|nr:Peptidyl-tRNA hydrolase [Gracilariopsis chorda]|eukprot:PXF41071.1 Peptidyl-tRNA hydrolase [Gracilariopsis chorda]
MTGLPYRSYVRGSAFVPVIPVLRHQHQNIRLKCLSQGARCCTTSPTPSPSNATANPSPLIKQRNSRPPPPERGNKLLVVGLGNPGPRFDNTRHNVGFTLLDQYAARHSASKFRRESSVQGDVARFHLHDRSVMLLKPSTFMNASGRAVRAALKYIDAPVAALLVVTDDISLDLGDIRLRAKGSAGGHNGLKSIQQCVGGMNYARLRIGVGSPSRGAEDWADFVLGSFSRSEKQVLDKVEWDVMEAIDYWVDEASIEKVQTQIALAKQRRRNHC